MLPLLSLQIKTRVFGTDERFLNAVGCIQDDILKGPNYQHLAVLLEELACSQVTQAEQGKQKYPVSQTDIQISFAESFPLSSVLIQWLLKCGKKIFLCFSVF